jgi:hypothetical protein
MTKNNPPRSVVITGASTGIGRACALYLDNRGFSVFAGVRREEDAAALMQEASSNLTPIFLDVTKPSMIEAAKDEITNELGNTGLAGLVNNAGIPLGGPLEFVSIPDLRYELEVNLIGSVSVTQAFLPLIRQGQGRTVNISATVLANKLAAQALSPKVQPQLIARTREYVRAGYKNFEAWFQENAELFSLVPPQAAAIAFVRYHKEDNSSQLVDRLIHNQSTYVVPGDHFGLDHHLRISYGLSDEYVNEELRRVLVELRGSDV